MDRLTTLGSKPDIGLIEFLGSNCNQDCIDVLKSIYDIDVKRIWHTETDLPSIDGLIIPGGFSYGDFLRGGALASHTKIIGAVKKFIDKGGPVIGICNGFQVLTESHILPGALLKNISGTFVCKVVELSLGEGTSDIHLAMKNKSFKIPIAHGEGRYFIDDDGLKKLKNNGEILFRYKNNPNGSKDNIAGILSSNYRVIGMMPHPERSSEKNLRLSTDGLTIWDSFFNLC